MKTKKTHFQRLQEWLQRKVCRVTGCRYRWRVRLQYSVGRTDSTFIEGTVETTARCDIENRREIAKALDARQAIEESPYRSNGKLRVVPVAYLGWF